MKVILLRDVPKIGKKFDIKDISDGYASNFLFPKKLAEPATDAKIKAITSEKAKHETEIKQRDAKLAEALSALDGTTVTIHAKADERGHLFKKLRVEDVVTAINKTATTPVDVNMVALASPLTQTGEHAVTIEVGTHTATVTIAVEREK